MAEPTQGVFLDLANAFAGQAELAPDLFQGVAAPVLQAVSQTQDTGLARGQGVQHFAHLGLQLGVMRALFW